MASRFFLTEDTTAPAVSPTISATDWLHVNTVRRKLISTADSSALGTTAYTPDSADDLIAGKAHHRQYISDPLAAQTISSSSTVQAQFQTLEAHANNNLTLTLKVYTVDSGGTLKSLLLAIVGKGTEPTTALRNTSFAATALNGSGGNVTVADGDRLVVEVGLGGTPTATSGTQGHNGSIRWGCNASSGDLPVDETQAGTTYRPWVEFSANLLFFKGGALGADALGSYADAINGGKYRLGWSDATDAALTSASPGLTVSLGPDPLGSYADAVAKEHRTVAGWIDQLTTFISGVLPISVNLPADNLVGYADTLTILLAQAVSISDSLGLYADQPPTIVEGYRVTPTADALILADQAPTISFVGLLSAAPAADSLGLYADQAPTIREGLLLNPAADAFPAYGETINGFFTVAARPSDDLNQWVDQRAVSTGSGLLNAEPPPDSLASYTDASKGFFTQAAGLPADALNNWLDNLSDIIGLQIQLSADAIPAPADQLAAFAARLASLAADGMVSGDQLAAAVNYLAQLSDSLANYGDQLQAAAGGGKTAGFTDALGSYADAATVSTALFRVGWADSVAATQPAVRLGWNDSVSVTRSVGNAYQVDLASVRPVPLDNLNLRLGQNYGNVVYLVDENGNYIVDENGNRFLVSGLIDTLQQGDSVAITRTVSGLTPRLVTLTDALPVYADSLQVALGIVTLSASLSDALAVYSDGFLIQRVGILIGAFSDALGGYNDSNPAMTTSGEQRVSISDALANYLDSIQVVRVGNRSVSLTDALDPYLDSGAINTSGGISVPLSDALAAPIDSIQAERTGALTVGLLEALGGSFGDAFPTLTTGILRTASDNLAGYVDSVTQARGLGYALTDGLANYLDNVTTAGSGQRQVALSDNLGQYADSSTTFANFKVQLADTLTYTDSLTGISAINLALLDFPVVKFPDSIEARYGLFNELRYSLTDTSLNHWADSATYKRGFYAIRVGGELTDRILLTGKVIEEQIDIGGTLDDSVDISGELYIGET